MIQLSKCPINISDPKILALLSMLRKIFIFACYVGVIIVPLIIYARLIIQLEWPTDTSGFNKISIWFVIVHSIMSLISSFRLPINLRMSSDEFWCRSPLKLYSIFSPGHLISLLIIWQFANMIVLYVWQPSPAVIAISFVPVYTYVVGVFLGCCYRCEYDKYLARNKLKDLSAPTTRSIDSDNGSIEPDKLEKN